MHSSDENPFAGDIHEKTTLSKKFSHAMHPIKKTFDDGFIHYSSQTDSFGQGRHSLRNSAGAKGGTIFWCIFLLHFWAIWENDPFSKSEKVPGLKPRLPRQVLRP